MPITVFHCTNPVAMLLKLSLCMTVIVNNAPFNLYKLAGDVWVNGIPLQDLFITPVVTRQKISF